MFWYFVFFFASGFCGLLYELIWLRLAMAQFGVTTALTSMVLSSFMAGLGTGSLAAGRLLHRHSRKISFPALRLYALVELLIACSAIAVPLELTAGHNFLAHMASAASFSSASYYVISGIWVALTLIPWCACMGATIPLAMFAISRNSGLESPRSFSFLYLSNVLGATLGATLGAGCRELPFEPFPFPFSKLELDLPAIQSAAPHPSQNRDPSRLCVLHLSQTIIGCVAGDADFPNKLS